MGERTIDETATSYLAWGGGTMIVVALIATAFATGTGIGLARVEPAVGTESRDLRMVEGQSGDVVVTDLAQPERTWIVRPSNGDGFVQVVVQGMMRSRASAGIDTQQPFRLLRQADGRLWLKDLSTQQQVALDAFGPVSARAFVKFLDDGKARQ